MNFVAEEAQMSVKRQCEVLQVSRSSFYRQSRIPEKRDRG